MPGSIRIVIMKYFPGLLADVDGFVGEGVAAIDFVDGGVAEEAAGEAVAHLGGWLGGREGFEWGKVDG